MSCNAYADYQVILPETDINLKTRIILLANPNIIDNTKPRLDLMQKNLPFICIESLKEKLLICCFYREWRDQKARGSMIDQGQRLNTAFEKIDLALEEKKRIIVLGDWNLDSLRQQDKDYHEIKMVKQLIQFFESRGLTHHVTGPTFTMTVKKNETQTIVQSCIDHVFSSDASVSTVKLLDTGASDHVPVIAEIMDSRNLKEKPAEKITKRCFKKFNGQQFLNDLAAQQWEKLAGTEDVDEMVGYLNNFIKTHWIYMHRPN